MNSSKDTVTTPQFIQPVSIHLTSSRRCCISNTLFIHLCVVFVCIIHIVMPSHQMFCQWNVYVANGCNLYGDGILANSSVIVISYRSVSCVAS